MPHPDPAKTESTQAAAKALPDSKAQKSERALKSKDRKSVV